MRLLPVNYHYFRNNKPGNGIYPVTLREFESQLDELSKYYEFISQVDLIEKIDSGACNKNYCLLTFDDGLKEQMDALEVITKKGIPGVFYVTTKAIRESKVMDVHKLQFVRSVMSDDQIFDYIQAHIEPRLLVFPSNIGSLYRYDTMQAKKIKYLLNFVIDEDLKKDIISFLFNQHADESEFSSNFYMNKDDVKKISHMNYLGTHTDAHLPLATLGKREIKCEIKKSLDFMKDVCDVDNIPSISYPYGGSKSVSTEVAKISEEFGFGFGLTMFRGINNQKDLNNRLLLKRVDTNDAPGGKLNSKEYCI